MKRTCSAAALVMLALVGCAQDQAKPAPVIVLSPMEKAPVTEQVKCRDPAPSEHDRAERWKAYAEKLEQQIGIKKHLGIDP